MKGKANAPVSTPAKATNGLAPPNAGVESVVSSDGETPSATPGKSVGLYHLTVIQADDFTMSEQEVQKAEVISTVHVSLY